MDFELKFELDFELDFEFKFELEFYLELRFYDYFAECKIGVKLTSATSLAQTVNVPWTFVCNSADQCIT